MQVGSKAKIAECQQDRRAGTEQSSSSDDIDHNGDVNRVVARTISSQHRGRDRCSEKLTNLSFRTKAISATVSGILAAGFATPLDICMQRIHSDRYIQSSSRSKIEKLPTNQASSMI